MQELPRRWQRGKIRIQRSIDKLRQAHAEAIAEAEQCPDLADKRRWWARAQLIEDRVAGLRRRLARIAAEEVDLDPAYTLFPDSVTRSA